MLSLLLFAIVALFPQVILTGAYAGLRGKDDQQCSGLWKACTESRCCTFGQRCYVKDKWYAQCRWVCRPGKHYDDLPEYRTPWNCSEAPVRGHTPTPAPTPTTSTPKPRPGEYRLDWAAEGKRFFDGFHFMTKDSNHGASDFVGSYEEGKAYNVTLANKNYAILSAGPRSDIRMKRRTVKVATKKSWKHFLAVMRFSHVPHGCGVWPAIFTLGANTRWPVGGEMDILEYVNDGGSVSSFHTSKDCKLDPAKINKFGPMQDMNLASNGGDLYDCKTRYCENCTSLGCAPNKLPLLSAPQMANTPGFIAMERTASFAKIFFIPENEFPSDLADDKPTPDHWDKWVISYYPFGDSEETCAQPDEIMAPQMFIIQIAFCGDWASKVWGSSPSCSNVGPRFNVTATKGKHAITAAEANNHMCRAVDPLAEHAPTDDCCHKFIWDEGNTYGTNAYLQERAFFNISWFKVFT